MLTVGSLFSGIGGFDLGLERAGMKVIWQSEIDPYASAVLRKHWPDVPNLGDIREIRNPPAVDVLCGGFPCQDISTAGKGAGIEGERSGLWREYARIIGEIRPRFVFVENVAALLGRGLGRVLGDLAALRYDAEWHCIPASAVGAPHRRDRLWIVAYANSEQPNGGLDTGAAERGEEVTSTRAVVVSDASSGRACSRQANVADTDSERGRGGAIWGAYAANAWESSGCAQFGHWDAEPDVGRVANGVSAKLDGTLDEFATALARSKGITKNDAVFRCLREMRSYGELTETSPQLRGFRLLSDPVSLLSRRLACGGKIAETDEELRHLWESVSAESLTEAQNMLKEMLERIGTNKRGKAMGSRADRLRCLGNAIVPQIAEVIGRAIMSAAA